MFAREVFKIARADLTLAQKKKDAKAAGIVQAEVVRCVKYLEERRREKTLKIIAILDATVAIKQKKSYRLGRLEERLRVGKSFAEYFSPMLVGRRISEHLRPTRVEFFKTNYIVTESEVFCISATKELVGKYGKTSWDKFDYYLNVMLPHDFMTGSYRAVTFDDGFLTIYKKKDRRQIGFVSLFKAQILPLNISGTKIAVKCYCAAAKGYSYHAETAKEALRGLRRKLNREFKRTNLTLDTFITASSYASITGACKLGIKEWIADQGITAKKIKLSELLPMLEETGAYGLREIKASIRGKNNE